MERCAPKLWLGDYLLLKKCTVLFVSCLCWAALPAKAEFTVNVPLTPIQQVLVDDPTERCQSLPELRSQPIAEALGWLYQANGYIPIWQDRKRTRDLREQLLEMAHDGLNPQQYVAERAPGEDALCRELRQSGDYLRALEHLSRGRLDQQHHEPVWTSTSLLPPARVEVDRLGILGLEDMQQAFDSARPSLPLYHQLRQAYQQMDHHAPELVTFPDGPAIKPGSNDPRLAQLAQRLMFGGYLAPGASAGPLTEPVLPSPEPVRGQPLSYDVPLQQAVRAFQQAHGLQPDAIVGQQTVAALNISPADRVRQVQINLERLRWLDARRHHHVLLVNSAGSNAILYQGNEIRWQSRVQSGSPDRATPLLDSRISRVTLNPSWTIPPTIMREDKLPQIRANPAYFAERDLQVLDAQGNRLNPMHIDWTNPRGVMLRQPPGPDNPLGQMVFRFDNPFSVFLHDTPSQSLFARAIRNVSSGCVRVEQATELADYLFHSLDAQQREQIEEQLASGKTREVRVENGPQVLLTYWTAQASADGQLWFTPDPYALDGKLTEVFARAVRSSDDAGRTPAER